MEGSHGDTTDNTCLPSNKLSTYPGHQHGQDAHHFCSRTSYLIFYKQHQGDIMGKIGTELDFLILVLWFLTVLYIRLLWRVEVALPVARSSKGLTQPFRRKLS